MGRLLSSLLNQKVSLLSCLISNYRDCSKGVTHRKGSRKHLCNYMLFVTMEISGNGSFGVWQLNSRFGT